MLIKYSGSRVQYPDGRGGREANASLASKQSKFKSSGI